MQQQWNMQQQLEDKNSKQMHVMNLYVIHYKRRYKHHKVKQVDVNEVP
jgi:hypothetical protein